MSFSLFAVNSTTRIHIRDHLESYTQAENLCSGSLDTFYPADQFTFVLLDPQTNEASRLVAGCWEDCDF